MSKKCINCGAELDDEALFCDECGTRQTSNQEPDGNQASPASGNAQADSMNQVATEKKVSGFGIASLVLGILAICTFGILIIPEILGIVFGIISMKRKDVKNGVAIVGITTSIISVLLVLILVI